MTQTIYSRHRFTLAEEDVDGNWFLSTREPYTYRDLTDNYIHVCSGDETLEELAGRFYADIPRGCGLFWIIADFQPEDEEPILDPTLRLEVGRELVIPSLRTVLNEILGQKQRSV